MNNLKPVLACLVMLCATPACAWDVSTSKDCMTDRAETFASVPAAQSGVVNLIVGCMNGHVEPRIWLSNGKRIGYGRIGVSYRFDDGKVVPRFGYLSGDGASLYLWTMDYAEAPGEPSQGQALPSDDRQCVL